MRVLLPRAAYFDALAAKVADPAALAALHAATPVPPDIAGWLQRLALLYDVPFGHLVPDEQMLPSESMRFFVVDTNWINALLEGACSIGRSSSADDAHDAALAGTLYAAANAPAQASGFLLRSAVVSGWPNLEVTAFANGAEVVKPLRMERLAPAVLLYVAAGLIERVDIHEPAEGLHFGVDVGDSSETLSASKQLRWIALPSPAPEGATPGAIIDKGANVQPRHVTTTVRFRTGQAAERTIAIAKLAGDIKTRLHDAGAHSDEDLTASEFALELVEGAQLVRFTR